MISALTVLGLNYSKPRTKVLKPVLERFLEKINVVDSGCWEWIVYVSKNGYGQFEIKVKKKYAHRISYELFNNVIPKGLQIDHLCKNRKCVNPIHLEAVTSRENTMRGLSPAAKNSKKNYCQNGHKFTIQNTIIQIIKNRKKRHCRICKYTKTKQYYREKRYSSHYKSKKEQEVLYV